MQQNIRAPGAIVIAAGGTAGHVLPAIALANALAQRVRVSFVGGSDGFESLLVPAAGFDFFSCEAQPLFGAGLQQRLRIPLALARGIAHARASFLRSRPALVVGFGGHATVAPVLAARSLGIPTALYEANVDPGIANRVLAPWVDRVHVAQAGTGWPARRTTVPIGMPIRRDLDRACHPVRTLPQKRSFRFLVLSGSQGSSFLNAQVPLLMDALRARGIALEVWHQAGLRSDLAAARQRYLDRRLPARVDGYLTDLCDAYRWADFAISAAGAGSLAELSAMALPALLVPLARAACNHQLSNARTYAAATGALVCEERAFDPAALAGALAALLGHAQRYAQRSAHARTLHQPGAADRLAASCVALAGADTQLDEASGAASFWCRADNDVASGASSTSLPERKTSARLHRA